MEKGLNCYQILAHVSFGQQKHGNQKVTIDLCSLFYNKLKPSLCNVLEEGLKTRLSLLSAAHVRTDGEHLCLVYNEQWKAEIQL